MQEQYMPNACNTIHGASIVKNVEARQTQPTGPQALGVALFPAVKDTRDLDVFPGDPVFEYLGDRSGMMVLETCLNGIIVPNQANADSNREYLYQNLIFRGFAIGAVRWEGRNTSSIVAQVDGLKMVVNTGTHKIEAGDVVCWQLPAADRLTPMCNHRSADFRTLELVPLLNLDGGGLVKTDVVAIVGSQGARALFRANDAADEDGKLRVFKDNIKSVMQMASLCIGRVVGTAMSSAEPGEVFTILVGGGAKQQISARLTA